MPKQERSVNSGHVKRLKQQAKRHRKNTNSTHAESLDYVARNAGFPNWKAVLRIADKTSAVQATTPPVSLNFVSDDGVVLSEQDENNLKNERSEEAPANIKLLVSKNRTVIADYGIEYSIFEPTLTGLGKSILDATQPVTTHFHLTKFHDYSTQQQGPDGRLYKQAIFLTPNEEINTKVSLYKPKTKKGDHRMWFSKLPSFAKAGDQLAIIVKEDTAFLINISESDLEGSVAAQDNIYDFLESVNFSSSSVAEELIDKLKLLAKNPLKAVGTGDKTVGITVEANLGIDANSSKEPDYKGIELKAGKGTKTRSNLFAQVAEWKRSGCKSSRDILEKYGYERDGDLKLYCTIRAGNRNAQGLMFELDTKNDDLLELDKKGTQVAVWSGDLLRKRLKEKHSETFWIQAEVVVVGGEQHFNLLSVVHTKSPLLSQLMPLIGSGIISMDHLIKRKGGDGRVTEKGPLFKIDKRDLPLLFPKPRVYSLI